MEPTSQGEVPKLNQVIQIDEGQIQAHLGEVVRSTVEETLNALLDAEADQSVPCRSGTSAPKAGRTRGRAATSGSCIPRPAK